MNLRRIGILLVANAGLALSQSPSPTFEVASVKPHLNPPGQRSFRFSSSGQHLNATGNRFTERIATLQDLVVDAYGVKGYQILNMPDWVRGEQYDIDAKSQGDATPTAEQLQLMLQALLADRFKLKLHREMKELPVYALVIGKNGHKLRELSEAEKAAANTPAGPSGLARLTGGAPPATLKSTVPMLMSFLSHFVDRPILDQTGLTGMYEYSMFDPRKLVSDAGRSVFSEVQDKMGLKLEPRKDPLEALVIDHAERPSAN